MVQWISLQLSMQYCSYQITIFTNLPPPSKCRLVRPAAPAPSSLRLCLSARRVPNMHSMSGSQCVGTILLWSPYGIGQTVIFTVVDCGRFLPLLTESNPNNSLPVSCLCIMPYWLDSVLCQCDSECESYTTISSAWCLTLLEILEIYWKFTKSPGNFLVLFANLCFCR